MLAAYAIALLILTVYLWRRRHKALGASVAFLWMIWIFHGPALFFFTEVWGTEWGFGQLPHLIADISSPDLIPRVYLAMTLCILCLLAGIKLYGWWPGDSVFRRSRPNPRENYSIEGIVLAALLSELAIALYLIAQFVLVASPMAIFNYYLSSVSEFDKVDIRRTASLSFYPYQVLLSTFFPFLAFVLVGEALTSARTRALRAVRWHALALSSLVLLAKIAQYNKSGPVIYVMQMVLIIAYSRSGSFRIAPRHLKLGLFALVAIAGMTLLVNSGLSLAISMASAFERTFMIPSEGVFEYFAVIPEHLPYGFGSGMAWVAALLGKSSDGGPSGTYWEVAAIVRGYYGSTSNSFFVADAYAEFSWVGVVLVSLLAGWLVRWYDAQVARWTPSPLATALLVSGYSACYTLATTSITTAMLTGGLVLTPWMAGMFVRRRTHAGAPPNPATLADATRP